QSRRASAPQGRPPGRDPVDLGPPRRQPARQSGRPGLHRQAGDGAVGVLRMTGRRHPWLYRLAWLRRNRCSLLLGWLCVLILANPVFTTTRLGAKSLAIGLMIVLLLA